MPPFAPRTRTLTGAVRAYFGLSQTDLARLLGCSQAAVARDEAGTHPLPPGPAARLLALSAWLEEATTPPPTTPPPHHPTALAPLHARLADCRHELARLARPLPPPKRAATRPAPAAARLAAAEAVPAALAAANARHPLPPAQTALQNHQWALLVGEARLVLDAGPDPGPTLRAARRAGLLAEIAVLEAALLG